MQDVLGEANLSADAVYRYFASKDEIIAAIAAIAGEAVAEVAGALDTAFDADDPPPLDEVLGAAFLAIRRVDAEQGMAKLALQVWGEAVRSPALAETLRAVIARVQGSLAWWASTRTAACWPPPPRPSRWPGSSSARAGGQGPHRPAPR
jgi:AcrR family transcriptional regulator